MPERKLRTEDWKPREYLPPVRTVSPKTAYQARHSSALNAVNGVSKEIRGQLVELRNRAEVLEKELKREGQAGEYLAAMAAGARTALKQLDGLRYKCVELHWRNNIRTPSGIFGKARAELPTRLSWKQLEEQKHEAAGAAHTSIYRFVNNPLVPTMSGAQLILRMKGDDLSEAHAKALEEIVELVKQVTNKLRARKRHDAPKGWHRLLKNAEHYAALKKFFETGKFTTR